MERDFYLGRILTGRISSGIILVGDRVHGLRIKDSGVEKIEEGKVRRSLLCLIAVEIRVLFSWHQKLTSEKVLSISFVGLLSRLKLLVLFKQQN